MNQLVERQDGGMTVHQMAEQVNRIQSLMRTVMKDDVHYGLIPGTGKKALLKPGAEKIGLMFGCRTKYEIRRDDLHNGHREYEVLCHITDRQGNHIGSGVGACTTMEKKYRYRAENTGKPVPRDYWESRDQSILGGPSFVPRKNEGRWFIFQQVEYDNPADYYNTVLKMAKKRAYVDAILTCTAASDFFDQEEVIDTPELYPDMKAEQQQPAGNQRQQYPDDQFQKNLPEWRELVDSGKATPNQIITTVGSKYVLTAEQKSRIQNLKSTEEANENP